MTHITQINELGEKLCDAIDSIANSEKNYHTEVGQQMEQYSWEIFRMINTINEFNKIYGI